VSFEIHRGDSRDVLNETLSDSIDSCVTDPPYALLSIHRRFANSQRTEAAEGTAAGPYRRTGRGFMGQKWDTGEVAHDVAFWSEVFRVLKPGGHLVAFGGTRTYHRLACAIEDAGFEIRDQIGWRFGSGFPKSHNQETGWGTALKPAWEPICLARKPITGTVAENISRHGTGAINIDGCRIPSEGGAPREGEASQDRRYTDRGATNFAAKPGPRGGGPFGRWPANVIHDGSDEVLAAFPPAPGQIAKAATGGNGSAARFFYCAKASRADRNDGCEHMPKKPLQWWSFHGDETDKAANNHHPTVKPTALMRYLCRLVTPAGGTILDPFMGSGSTGKAAVLEGFKFIGIDREAEYVEIAKARIEKAATCDPFQ
jgi:site-specific DNA-methyltransferase (adenine-specific)